LEGLWRIMAFTTQNRRITVFGVIFEKISPECNVGRQRFLDDDDWRLTLMTDLRAMNFLGAFLGL
jgi:hypothetical protein